jgi:hypothetical protein
MRNQNKELIELWLISLDQLQRSYPDRFLQISFTISYKPVNPEFAEAMDNYSQIALNNMKMILKRYDGVIIKSITTVLVNRVALGPIF